jgi:hypothetical protein
MPRVVLYALLVSTMLDARYCWMAVGICCMHAEHVALRSLIRAHFHQVLTARMATGLYIQGDLHVDGSWYSGVLGGQSATRGALLAEGHVLTGSEEHRGVPQMPPALQRPPASRTTCTLHAPARQPHSCDHCASIPCVRSHARPRDRPCEAKGRSRRSVYIAWSCRASPVGACSAHLVEPFHWSGSALGATGCRVLRGTMGYYTR